MSHDRYEMVVGLEVHVQLKTRTKAFCGCAADFGAPPNTNVCPVCLALPGSLPVLNERAVALGVRAALALGCVIHAESVFARKHYFYPDLPKGYQISQFDRPLASAGTVWVDPPGDRAARAVGVTRVHLEEDAGKSIHDRYRGATAIDLNRCGVPLMEIVSEPDLRSAADAGAYLRELKLILEYLDVSDANMEEGSLRVDANVSTRPRGRSSLGTKTEIKNMNSFSGVERALEAEFTRQCGMLDRGEPIERETLLWDAAREEIRPAREKEESHDYRYFPDPDLPTLRLSAAWIDAERVALPELPAARRARLQQEFAISASDARVLTASRALADYYESLVRSHGDGKTAANWVTGTLLGALHDAGVPIERFTVPPDALAELLDLVRAGTVSRTAAKQIFAVMQKSGEPARAIAEREKLIQVGDDAQLAVWVDEVLHENAGEARRFMEGEARLLGVLVGLVMKKSKGRADPKRVNQILVARQRQPVR
jgi:aspartyl-tRNA(Asn)/glutamyl-tRNA(Gln) amidotransferase subunit B